MTSSVANTNPGLLKIFGFICVSLGLQFPSDSAAYEEPEYAVVDTWKEFEIREYAPMMVAEVMVESSFDEAGDVAFRKLFKFISGENRGSTEIAMTVPVNQQKVEGERIEMTAPVLQSEESPSVDGQPSENSKIGKFRFSFVMPGNYNQDNIPTPNDPAVQTRMLPSKLMAVRRYSGFWSESNYRRNEKVLLDALESRGLRTKGEPIYARYNAPFSIWFLRRNEVLIELER